MQCTSLGADSIEVVDSFISVTCRLPSTLLQQLLLVYDVTSLHHVDIFTFLADFCFVYRIYVVLRQLERIVQ